MVVSGTPSGGTLGTDSPANCFSKRAAILAASGSLATGSIGAGAGDSFALVLAASLAFNSSFTWPPVPVPAPVSVRPQFRQRRPSDERFRHPWRQGPPSASRFPLQQRPNRLQL